MPDEVGTEATRSDAASAKDSPFADTEDDKAAPADGQETDKEAAQEPNGPDGAGEETAPSEELKVVVSIKGGRAVIGVQQPSSDPHIETFEDHDLPALAQEVVAVTERARGRWEDAPKHPAYERPAPPARRRNRRQQGAAQTANAQAETETGQAQQQTLRLF